ncbi:hypothetical protein F5H01DRAFT_326141 [Linnemannia elongata]|nr:hypothetical protein F5H01DRAFT_326141 [Linnemannia elongata]
MQRNPYLSNNLGKTFPQPLDAYNSIFLGVSTDIKVRSVIEYVLVNYGKSFPTLKGLEKATRDGAIKNLKTIAQLVGYSTNAPDVAPSKALDEYYKDYITAKDYFGKRFKCSVCSVKDTLRQLPLTANKNSTGMVPTTVNAYYSPSFNSISFSAGVLPSPFFNVENLEYINSGSMGVGDSDEYGVDSPFLCYGSRSVPILF